jgi:hypothetical protein
METIATLLATLPHHSECGMFENPRSVPAWEERVGARFPTALLADGVTHLRAANARNDGVEWGDTRARHINSSWAGFLQFAIDGRTA